MDKLKLLNGEFPSSRHLPRQPKQKGEGMWEKKVRVKKPGR